MFTLAAFYVAAAITVAPHCAVAPSAIDVAFVGTGATDVTAEAIAEAAHVWGRYGVSIQSVPAPGAHAVLIRVRLAHGAAGGALDSGALGTIEFHDGVPDPDITLYPERAWALVAAAVGPAAARWPVSYRELVLGRVLGRALAHELGHYLLQASAHSGAGLMRALQSIANLMGADGSGFMLSPAEIAAVQGRNNCAAPDVDQDRTDP